jgi:polysaccharide export outer membrane protein
MKHWLIALFLSLSSLTCLASNPGDYQLGAGDVVKVAVYANPDLATEGMLSSTGELSFPLLGKVRLAGQTIDQAQNRIAEALRSGGYVNQPQVTLIVSQYRSQQVSAIGEFNHPGVIALDRPTDLLSVVALAGGVDPNGGDSVVVIHGRERTVYSISQLMAETDMNKRTVLLGSGDVVYAPRSLVFVNGEVNHPGGFRLEVGMTVIQSIAEAGGFTPKASQRSVAIHRTLPGGEKVDLNAGLTDALQVGDVVDVAESWF